MSGGFTFTQGFIVGQLSVVVLIAAFIKFFIFGDAPSPQKRTASKRSIAKHVRTSSFHSLTSSKTTEQSLRHKSSASNVLRAVPTNATDTSSILRKTYYQIAPSRAGGSREAIHQPESLDWFNVLIAQTIAQYRQTAYNLKDDSAEAPSILSSLTAALNDKTKMPSFVGPINITEISLGEEFPIFSNVRVIAVEDEALAPGTGGRLQALVDVDLSDDNLTLGIETSLLLNYPQPMSAILPFALTVSVVRFSGTLSVSFVPVTQDSSPTAEQASSDKPKTSLAFSFLPDYRLDLSVRSLIGSRSRLQDVPKIAQLVEAQVQSWFEERVVEPRVQVVPLPGLWPRLQKTRVREGQEDDRPVSRDESRFDSVSRRKLDNLPSQAETEALFEGLRWRTAGGTERNYSQDEDVRIPGSLPG